MLSVKGCLIFNILVIFLFLKEMLFLNYIKDNFFINFFILFMEKKCLEEIDKMVFLVFVVL